MICQIAVNVMSRHPTSAPNIFSVLFHYLLFLHFIINLLYDRFIDIYIGWPGCVHDARVLNNSSLYRKAEDGTLLPQVLPYMYNFRMKVKAIFAYEEFTYYKKKI